MKREKGREDEVGRNRGAKGKREEQEDKVKE
jgi:hypothetical protein